MHRHILNLDVLRAINAQANRTFGAMQLDIGSTSTDDTAAFIRLHIGLLENRHKRSVVAFKHVRMHIWRHVQRVLKIPRLHHLTHGKRDIRIGVTDIVGDTHIVHLILGRHPIHRVKKNQSRRSKIGGKFNLFNHRVVNAKYFHILEIDIGSGVGTRTNPHHLCSVTTKQYAIAAAAIHPSTGVIRSQEQRLGCQPFFVGVIIVFDAIDDMKICHIHLRHQPIHQYLHRRRVSIIKRDRRLTFQIG
mmetsp:Transcript_29197/g.47716  ORF Transcript_29197/g.47716 Transcript_29197/m.47716 type:complete len:246 (-) Transcript_29197:1207-1944(-)